MEVIVAVADYAANEMQTIGLLILIIIGLVVAFKVKLSRPRKD